MDERTDFCPRVSIRKSHGEMMTHRQVVEIWHKKQDTDDTDNSKENTTHWGLSTCCCIDFAPTISAKCRQSHEAAADDICDPQCYKLTIGTQRHTLYALAVCPLAASKTFRSNRRFEKAKQSNEEGGTHSFSHVSHVRWYQRPLEWER